MCTALTGSLQIIRFHNNVSIIDDKMWDIDILLSCLVLHSLYLILLHSLLQGMRGQLRAEGEHNKG